MKNEIERLKNQVLSTSKAGQNLVRSLHEAVERLNSAALKAKQNGKFYNKFDKPIKK